MDRRELRKFNHYLNLNKQTIDSPRIVTGKMGRRDRNTGRYTTELYNQGTVLTRFIGLSSSRSQGYTTEIDTQGWSDN